MTRRWQREMDNADATAKAKAIDADRANYYDADVDDFPSGSGNEYRACDPARVFEQHCECGQWKSHDNAVCDDCFNRHGGEDHQ